MHRHQPLLNKGNLLYILRACNDIYNALGKQSHLVLNLKQYQARVDFLVIKLVEVQLMELFELR